MAFEINDLKGILILVLFAIPTVVATNINCSGRAFHCVNSTHFMICVDLGGGVSTTIDDFVIPCPARTVCNENNIFECDFPEDPTPPLQVIGVNKQSDTSEPNPVTTSVTTPTQTSEIFSVFNENITATTLPILEDVMPAVKLEVLENIKNSAGGNSYNTTETSAPSSFIGSTNKTVKDKQTSNITLTTSATDKNSKKLENAVETSILEAVNASLTDKSTPNDTVTSVIGLINLISTDPPSVVSTNRSSNVLTSLDSSYDIIATTTDQYITKEVTIHSDKVKNVTEQFNIPTENTFSEISTTKDGESPTPLVNKLIVSEINNKFENMSKTNSGNHTIVAQNNFGKSNNTNKLIQETTTEYLAPITTNNISEPISVDLIPQTTTGSAFGHLGLVEIISAEPNQSIPSINDYIDTSYGNAATSTTTDIFNSKLETTLNEKPVTAKVISTTPITNMIVQNVINNDTTTKLNPTSDIRIIETVQETKTNYYVPEPKTTSLQTTIEKTSIPITTETNIKYTTVKIATNEALFNNDSRVQKPAIVAQTLEIIRTTDSPTVVTDNLYQINGDFNQTLISTENISVDTMNSTERTNGVYNDLGIDVMNNKKVTEPILVLVPSVKNSVIEITTAETIRNGFTAPAIEVSNESTATNVASSVNGSSLLDNKTNIVITTATPKMLYNVSSSNSETSTIEYNKIEILTTETLQNKNESPANDPMSVHTTATDTTAKDLTSQSEIKTYLHTGYTQEINAHTAPDGYSSVDLGRTQRTMTDPESKIPEPLNQPDILKAMMIPEILNTDQWTNNVPDEISTTRNLNNIEIRVTTPFPSEFIENTVISNIDKIGNQDYSSATSLPNTQEVSAKIIETSAPPSNHYVTELSSTTAETVHTTPRTDSTKIFIQTSTNTPKIANIHTVSVTDYKIKTSSLFSVDVTRPTNVENVTDSPTRTIPQQELLNQKNNTNTTAITPATVITAGYVLDTKNIDLNISNQEDSVNMENRITKEDSIINKSETLKPIYYNNSGNATSTASTEKPKKDENIKIVSVLNIVNSSGNAMAIEMLQQTSTNPSLSNDYIQTSESQASSVYVTASDNVPDYNSVQHAQSVKKNPDVSVPCAEIKLMNSSTPNTHTFPVTELNTEPVQYVSTEAPILSTNPRTIAADYVAEKTNNYFATEAMLSQLNKLPNVQAETTAGLVKSITPRTAITLNGFTTVPIYDEITTIKDSAFIISSNHMPPQIVADINIKMSTEPPRLTSKVMEPQTVKYNTESSLPIPELPDAKMITEPTHKTLDNTNQNVQPGIKTIDLPQYVLSTSLPIVEVIASERTTEPTHATILAQITPHDMVNQNVQTVLKSTDLPQYVTSTVNKNIPQSMPIVEVTASERTTEPVHATIVAQTTPLDMMNQNVQTVLKSTDLPQYVTSTVNKNIPQSMPSLPIVEVTASERSTEPTHATIFAQTTPLDMMNQNVQTVLKTTDLPQYVTSTVNKNIPQSMPSLPIVEVTASERTTEPVHATILAQITPHDMVNQNVQTVLKSTDLPQYVTSTVNKNIPQSMPSLPIVEVTASERTTEPVHATILAQTTPLDMMNQNVQTVLKSTDLPQYVTSTVNKNIPQSMPSLPIVEVTASERSTEPAHATILAQTTPLDMMNQNVQTVLKTTDLPQYVTSTVNKNIPQSMPSLPIVEVTASERTTEPVHATILAQITPHDMVNQNVQTVLESTDLPQYVTSTVNKNIPQSMPSLPIVEVTASERTTEPVHATILAQITPHDMVNQNVQTVLKSTDLPQYVTSTVNKNIPQSMPSLPIVEVTASERSTEPTHATILAQTTPLDMMNQNVQTVLKTTDLPQYVTSTVNKNIPQSMPSLPIVEVRASERTTEPTHATILAQTTPLGMMNQNVQTVLQSTDLPQYVTSTVNNNIPQSVPSLPILEVTAAERTTETILFVTNKTGTTNQKVQPVLEITNLPQYVTSKVNYNIPQSVPSLSILEVTAAERTTETTLFVTNKTGTTNQKIQPALEITNLPQYVTSTVNHYISQPDVAIPVMEATASQMTMPLETNHNIQPGIKTIVLPQYVLSTVNNTNPQPMPSLHITEATTPQITTEPTDTTNAFAVTTPLAAGGKVDQVIVPGIKTTVLPQFITIPYSNAQSITDITTETIIDTTVPDSMVESIKVVEDKVSGTHQGETILSDVMYNIPTVNNYSVKSVKNIIDHESIVVGVTSKNYKQNTPRTAAHSVNIIKAEIVNLTESNWMPSDVNIDTIKIKESSIEEEDLKTSVLKLGADVPNKNLDSDSAIISEIQPKDGKSIDKIEYRLTTVITDYKQAKTPKNVTQSKTIITSENNNAEIDSSVNVNIEIIDVKTYQVQVDSKNISDSYSINDTKDINIISHHNSSLQNSTINYDLEKHLIAANHTITTEVQSHLNESDKQSSKTSKEPAINGTSLHNPSTQNASSKDTVPASVLNCSNHTRGKYSDKKDCRKFYTCVGTLQPIIGTCPNNTVFSEINKQCTRNLSHCVRNNQFRCLFEGRFTDFFKDNIYYICVKNRNNHFIRYKLQCKEDYHLNKDSIKCEKNEEISTQLGSSVSETINDESMAGPKSEKIVISDDFKCVKEGKFPNANDCSEYYICVKNINNQFIRYKLQCQDGYHLNKNSVKCEKNQEISTKSVSETINDESKPKPKSEKYVSSDDFECEKEGKFPHAKDCSKYYVCTKVKNVFRRKITKCANDDVFDKNKKKCVESDSGEC